MRYDDFLLVSNLEIRRLRCLALPHDTLQFSLQVRSCISTFQATPLTGYFSVQGAGDTLTPIILNLTFAVRSTRA